MPGSSSCPQSTLLCLFQTTLSLNSSPCLHWTLSFISYPTYNPILQNIFCFSWILSFSWSFFWEYFLFSLNDFHLKTIYRKPYIEEFTWPVFIKCYFFFFFPSPALQNKDCPYSVFVRHLTRYTSAILYKFILQLPLRSKHRTRDLLIAIESVWSRCHSAVIFFVSQVWFCLLLSSWGSGLYNRGKT